MIPFRIQLDKGIVKKYVGMVEDCNIVLRCGAASDHSKYPHAEGTCRVE
jgi:hypothetical protein